MLSDQLQTTLSESTSEVLEAMFFMDVLGDAPETVPGEMVSAQLAFEGKPSGRFGIGLPVATGKLIASNFLGKAEEEISRADIDEVTCELTNMVCGSVLSRVEAGARFELLHPTIVPAGSGFPPPEAITSCLELEYGAITVWIATPEIPLVTP